MSLTLACGGAPDPAPPPEEASAAPAAADLPSVVNLSPEAVQRAGIATAKVQVTDAPNLLVLPGQVALNEDGTVTAASFVEGIVTECCTPVGSYVRAGSVLAELHSHRTHELLGEYRKAQAVLKARQSEQTYAGQAAQRARRLLELKAGSEREVQQTASALAVAETSVLSAQADVDSALSHFEYLGVETGELRRGEVPDHLLIVVKSPIDGVVVERTVAQGDVVSPSDPLYRISDLTQVWVIARASEQQLQSVVPGMIAGFRVRAFADKVFAGRVLRISDELDIDTKTVQVVVSVANPGRSLKTGMYGDVELRSSVKKQVIAIPEAAVQLVDAQETVFVADGPGVYRPRAVTVGRGIGSAEEILDGLEPEETIVVEGAFALKSELLKSRFAEEE
jgi:cobalt-zinc-cadmium efflux system membrane fusion protein